MSASISTDLLSVSFVVLLAVTSVFFGCVGFLVFVAAMRSFPEIPAVLVPDGFRYRWVVWLLKGCFLVFSLAAIMGVMVAVHPLLN